MPLVRDSLPNCLSATHRSYAHRWNWLLLLVLVAAGAAVRHVLNVRFTYPRWKPALAATLAGSAGALAALLMVPQSGTLSAVSSRLSAGRQERGADGQRSGGM